LLSRITKHNTPGITVNRSFLLAAGVSSLLLIAASPPSWAGVIAFTCLIPLFYIIDKKNVSYKKIFLMGYVTGVIWACGTLYWISLPTLTGFIGSVIYLPLYPGIFCVIMKWVKEKTGIYGLALAPFVWTTLEIVQARGVFGFTWQSIAYTQTYANNFIQFASVTGMYGVTFWVVSLNVLLYLLFTERKRFVAGAVLAVFILLPFIYSSIVMKRGQPVSESSWVTVSVVQGNVDPYKKWKKSFIDSNYVIYRDLTMDLGNTESELVVWPETAVPYYLRYRYNRYRQVRDITDSLGVNLLTGAPGYFWDKKGKGHPLNKAFFIRPFTKPMDSYAKIHLVPFSEFVPFREQLPFLEPFLRNLNLDVGDFTAGDSIVVFSFTSRDSSKDVQFSSVICFDSIFPELVRQFFRKGAQFLVIITNDGWFGKTSGPYQHQRIAVLRAIENRSWVVRCANTGVSCFIDPYGRVVQKTGLMEQAVLTQNVALSETKSIFTKHGLIFPYFIVIISFLALASIAVIGSRGEKRTK